VNGAVGLVISVQFIVLCRSLGVDASAALAGETARILVASVIVPARLNCE
jgi:hypothetical protein